MIISGVPPNCPSTPQGTLRPRSRLPFFRGLPTVGPNLGASTARRFVLPCLPTKAHQPPSGELWLHEIFECIGKGKASAPYEFGVKASIVTTNARTPGGQFVLHARALPGNPYDGHTLGAVIEATERLTGREIERAYVDKGYRGHDAPNPRRVFISGQKRGVFGRIKRELTRRSAI